MLPNRNSRRALGAVFFTLAPLCAQIPDGAHVMSSLKVPTIWAGNSGVFVGHPRDPEAITPLTGLPETITYASDNNPGAFGANCVLHDPSNGGVIVGTNGRAGETLHLHRLTLSGLDVTNVELFTLGQLVANGGGLFEMDWINDHEVVCAIGAINGAAGTPATVQLCRVDLQSGTVSPVAVPNYTAGGFINAVAYDAASGDVYFGVGGLPSGDSLVFSMPLAAPATPTLVATLPGAAVRNLAVDSSGDVLAGCGVAPGGATPALVRIGGGVVTPVLSGFDNVNAFAVEPTTGEFAIAGQDDRTDTARYGHYFYGGGGVTVLGLTRADGNQAGPLSGIDAAPAPVEYGSPSGSATFEWNDTPDPRRLPVAGEMVYATLDWPAGVTPFLGFAAIAAAPGNVPMTGYNLLLDPSATLPFTFPLRRDSSNRQSTLRFPLAPPTKGRTVYVQALQFAAGGIAASAGLRVAIQ